MTAGAEATSIAPYMPFDLEDLLRLWRALGVWIIDLIHAVLVALEDLLHLLFGNEAAMVAEPVVGQVLAAVIAHLLLLVGSLDLLVPELEDFGSALVLRERRSAHGHIRAIVRATARHPAIKGLRLAPIQAPR